MCGLVPEVFYQINTGIQTDEGLSEPAGGVQVTIEEVVTVFALDVANFNQFTGAVINIFGADITDT